MNLGHAPLKLNQNTLLCSACDTALTGSCAGGKITSHHDGPRLVRVVVEVKGGRVVHDCDIVRAQAAAAAEAREAADRG